MSTAQKKWLPIGTSIVKDDAGCNCGSRTAVLMAYPSLIPVGANNDFVGENLFVGPSKIANQGNNGATISTVVGYIASLWTAIGGAHITTIEIGINDIIVGTPTSSLANVPNLLTAYGALLDMFPSLTPAVSGYKVVPMCIYNTLYQSGAWSAVVTAFNAGLAALVSARSSFCAGPGVLPVDLVASEFGDGNMIHPNQAGHKRGAAGYIAALASLV